MTHEDRLLIAREVASRILEKYGDLVSAIAVYGSVAKEEDSEYSDLDLWVATAPASPTAAYVGVEYVRFFVYKGIPVSINWDTEEGRIRSAKLVTPFWPRDADELRSYMVLFERGDFMHRLRAAASLLRDEDFVRSMQTLMARVYETFNKVRSSWEAEDRYRLLVEARMLAWGAAMMLGLLNKRYYPGGRGFYQLSKQMPKQPKDYARLIDLAGGFTSLESEVVYKAAGELWDSLCELMHNEGVEWEESKLPL